MTEQVSHTVTLQEAKKLIVGVKGKKRFSLIATSFMPTNEDRGFEGTAGITVTHKQFLTAIEHMLSESYANRGAKLRIHISPPRFDGYATNISTY